MRTERAALAAQRQSTYGDRLSSDGAPRPHSHYVEGWVWGRLHLSTDNSTFLGFLRGTKNHVVPRFTQGSEDECSTTEPHSPPWIFFSFLLSTQQWCSRLTPRFVLRSRGTKPGLGHIPGKCLNPCTISGPFGFHCCCCFSPGLSIFCCRIHSKNTHAHEMNLIY